MARGARVAVKPGRAVLPFILILTWVLAVGSLTPGINIRPFWVCRELCSVCRAVRSDSVCWGTSGPRAPK